MKIRIENKNRKKIVKKLIVEKFNYAVFIEYYFHSVGMHYESQIEKPKTHPRLSRFFL